MGVASDAIQNDNQTQPHPPPTSSSSARRRIALASCCAASLAASSACRPGRQPARQAEVGRPGERCNRSGPCQPAARQQKPTHMHQCTSQRPTSQPAPCPTSHATGPRFLPPPRPHLQARQGVSQQPAALLLILQVAASQGCQLAAQLAATQLLLIQLGPAGRSSSREGRRGRRQAPKRIRQAEREGRQAASAGGIASHKWTVGTDSSGVAPAAPAPFQCEGRPSSPPAPPPAPRYHKPTAPHLRRAPSSCTAASSARAVTCPCSAPLSSSRVRASSIWCCRQGRAGQAQERVQCNALPVEQRNCRTTQL